MNSSQMQPSETPYLPLDQKAAIQALVPERSELSLSLSILEGIIFWMALGVIFFGVTFIWNFLADNLVITIAAFVLLLPFVITGLRKKSKLTRSKTRIAEIDAELLKSGIQTVDAEEKIDPKRGIYYIYTVKLAQAESFFDLDPMLNESYR